MLCGLSMTRYDGIEGYAAVRCRFLEDSIVFSPWVRGVQTLARREKTGALFERSPEAVFDRMRKARDVSAA